jgi:uncharacterized protein (TIGR02679 family)
MNGQTDPRLQRLLGGEHLAPLRKRLRQSFERAPLDTPVDRIRIAGLSADEHAALASLAGRPQRFSKSLSIDVRRVDAGLRQAGVATSLQDALEKLDGPIEHSATVRLQLQAAWSGVIDGCAHPGLRGLLLTAEGIGLLKRLARQDAAAAAALCRRADAVLRRLPAQGVARSQLAADVLGDSHGLDAGRGTAALVLAAWRRADVVSRDGGDESPGRLQEASAPEPTDAVERIRDIWARAGVLVNELARPTLFLNVPVEAGSACWPAGEPAYASLRLLLRSPPRWDVEGRDVYVCENPNLLAIAADRWGGGCAPLICTDGMPAAAQRCLLSQLARAGARLRYHGDFDWPGLRIGNHVMREHGAEPWRFGAADYLAAAGMAPRPGHAITGKAVDASWDAALAAAMQEQRVSIAEEAVAAVLLGDLGGQ